MRDHGGVYVDVDCIPLLPLDEWLHRVSPSDKHSTLPFDRVVIRHYARAGSSWRRIFPLQAPHPSLRPHSGQLVPGIRVQRHHPAPAHDATVTRGER